MATDDIRPIVDWLVDGARSRMQAHEMLAELCERLVGCGIPLWRMAVFVRTLHPHIMGRRSFGVLALTSKSTTLPSTCSRARNSAVAPPPRFTPAERLFGGASRTPIALSIFPCWRSCGTKG